MVKVAGHSAGERGGRRRGTGPTVADVARRAGVSPMTVSRVANGESNVLPDTRRKVERAIDELGYVPNLAARSLAGGRPPRIALLHSNPSAAYLSEFLVGCLAEASKRGVQLVVEFYDEAERASDFARRIVSRRIDGVLLPPPLCDDDALMARLREAGLALVQVATGRPDGRSHAVTIDDEAAAFTMTRRLLESGHRAIGFITGNPNQTASGLRLAGYRRALAEFGVAARDDLVAGGDFTYRSGWEAAEQLLRAVPRPTAIFASNDDMAAAAISVAHRAGIDVPRELSVCGFDDTALATTIWPELTTIRQPIAEMARKAIGLLAEAVAGEGKPGAQHQRLAFTLIERGSDAGLESG